MFAPMWRAGMTPARAHPRRGRSLLARLVAGCFAVVLASMQPMAEAREADPKPYRIDWRVPVPMRDGIKLNATIYRPAEMTQPKPAIVAITPYIADSYYNTALYFAQRGYVFVMVDVRGRGNSEGEFEPFVMRESEDAHDVVEWVARQSWSNGKVGMQGASYGGHNQWLIARARPPHLSTVIPVASPTIGYDFPYRNNRAMVFATQWLQFVDGKTLNKNIAYDAAHWDATLEHLYRDNLPYAQLAAKSGAPAARFDEWVKNPSWGPYWEARNPTAANLATFDLPILSITGYYDGDQLGALRMYREHLRASSAAAREKHYLIIGPWSHAGTRMPTKELGGYTFSDASVIDMKALDLAWYDWTMMGGPKPEFLKDRVAYFVVGEDEWRYAPSLEAIQDREIKLHLSSGPAGGVFEGGKLQRQLSKTSKPAKYVYDPAKLAPRGSPASHHNSRMLVDARDRFAIRDDGVIYTSQPFDEPVVVAGSPRLEAWIEMDVPDTDFILTLQEILADGSSVLLTSDSLRARYRESRAEAKLVVPGKITKYTFDTFDFFARRIARGSRLQLVISGPRSFDYELNLNGGGVVAQETLRDARKATVKLHHGKDHPSALILPVAADARTSVARSN